MIKKVERYGVAGCTARSNACRLEYICYNGQNSGAKGMMHNSKEQNIFWFTLYATDNTQ